MPADLGVHRVKACSGAFIWDTPRRVHGVDRGRRARTRREPTEIGGSASREDPTVLVSVTPLHVGFFRLARQMTGSLETLSDTFGMSESEVAR